MPPEPVAESGTVSDKCEIHRELACVRRRHQWIPFAASVTRNAVLCHLGINDCQPQMQAIDHEKLCIDDAGRIGGAAYTG